MTDPFIGEIRLFGGNFAPQGWAFCNGQLLPISQNTALFSLLGTTYGGDGRTTFALPDLQGRAPLHPGQGPGLSPRDLGESGGSATVTLLASQIPTHTHAVGASAADAGERSPAGQRFANDVGSLTSYAAPGSPAPLAPSALGAAGGSAAHNNVQPSLGLTFIIALQGIYPPRQ